MKFIRTALLTSLLGLPALAPADPVDESKVTTFAAGQPACAGHVNQTIEALIAAINDNAARVAQLEAASVRPAYQSLLEKVSGSTYTLYSHETGLGASSSYTPENDPGTPTVGFTNGRLGHWSFTEDATLVLNTDGTLTFSLSGHEREVYADTLATHDTHSPGVPDIRRVDLSTPVDEVLAGTEPGTWSLNGQTLTLTVGDPLDDPDSFALVVSADGNILMAGINELENAGPVTLLLSGMSVGVRTNAQQIRVENFTGVPFDDGDELDFVTPRGETVSHLFRIHNVGDTTLGNLDVELTNTNPRWQIVQDLEVSSLGPGGQAVIKVSLTLPLSGGPAPTTLRITSDDPQNPQFDVDLREVVDNS